MWWIVCAYITGGIAIVYGLNVLQAVANRPRNRTPDSRTEIPRLTFKGQAAVVYPEDAVRVDMHKLIRQQDWEIGREFVKRIEVQLASRFGWT